MISAGSWKSFDWDAMNRLHEAEFIGDPKSKAKSVFLTPAGLAKGEELAEELFGREE